MEFSEIKTIEIVLLLEQIQRNETQHLIRQAKLFYKLAKIMSEVFPEESKTCCARALKFLMHLNIQGLEENKIKELEKLIEEIQEYASRI